MIRLKLKFDKTSKISKNFWHYYFSHFHKISEVAVWQ